MSDSSISLPTICIFSLTNCRLSRCSIAIDTVFRKLSESNVGEGVVGILMVAEMGEGARLWTESKTVMTSEAVDSSRVRYDVEEVATWSEYVSVR